MSEPPPPQTADNAVRAFILLFALGFVLRGIDVMDHDMPNAIQKWVIAAILSVADYFYVPIRTTLGPRFSNTAASVATDFRWWTAALMVILLGMSLSPYIEQHRWPFLNQIGTASPKQATPSTPIALSKPLGGQKIVTATELIEKVDSLQSQLDATNLELKAARQPLGSLSGSGGTLFTQEPIGTPCLTGNCPSLLGTPSPPSSAGNIFAIPSADKVAELEAAVRKLEDENRRLAKAAPSPDTPKDSGPIKWESVLWFPASSTGKIRFITLRGENSSSSVVQMKSASFASALTGENRELSINIPYGNLDGEKISVQGTNPIPSGAKIQLVSEWTPPISVQEFMNRWGKISLSIDYNDVQYRKIFDEEFMKAALLRDVVGADLVLGVPRVTKRESAK